MSPEEWIGIVHWLSDQNVAWTVDIATRYGVALQNQDAARVRQALTSLLDRKIPPTPGRIMREVNKAPSKYGTLLEAKHRELFPRGCGWVGCDVCLDKRER